MRKPVTLPPIKIGEYDYNLPDDRIAKYPLEQRDASKLLFYNDGKIEENTFRSAADYLPEGSLLVYNNTKVIQARIIFRKTTGARVEIFCLEPAVPSDYALSLGAFGSCSWNCMIGNLKKWKEGTLTRSIVHENKEIILKATREKPPTVAHSENTPSTHSDNISAVRSYDKSAADSQLIRFEWDEPGLCFADILELCGELPIPPYLNRPTELNDHTSYQTVYSKIKGSVAAPTAGLHFTDDVLADLKKKNIATEELTLHVGAGTFQPVKAEDIADHHMHTEVISVKKSTIEQLLRYEGNIIAVGTTSVRTLESLYYLGLKLHRLMLQPEQKAAESHSQQLAASWLKGDVLQVGQWEPYESDNELSSPDALKSILSYLDRTGLTSLQAQTQIIIRPGYNFNIIRGMFTNFHQPKSTLLLLVSAFVGDDWKRIYDYAMNNRFRFLSYGDSSLLLR